MPIMIVVMLIVQAIGHSTFVVDYAARGLIYDCYIFVVQATGIINDLKSSTKFKKS